MKEKAVLRFLVLDVARLSDGFIRDHLFLGTAPGNEQVAVSNIKGGMNAALN